VAWLNWWLAPVAVAAVLAVATAIYIRGRWRRAPVALNAMKVVAGVYLLCGFLSGIWVFHLTTARSESKIENGTMPGPPPSAQPIGTLPTPSGYTGASATGGSVPALEVGKAIAATYAAHSGDPSWTSTEALAKNCDQGMLHPDSLPCRGAYLALHSSGSELDRGPQDGAVSLSEVADFCDNQVIDSGSALCLRAYAAQKAAAK
jgi:hypothetical protein